MTRPTYATSGPKIGDRDPMTDFEVRELTLLDETKRVCVAGEGRR